MTQRMLYTNADQTRSALAFFTTNAHRCTLARLACPFFTTIEPLTILKTAGVANIQLMVRLCYVTMPEALHAAVTIPGVTIRYYASDDFHAKFYILGNIALLGSANLTKTGLQINHELAVTLHESDNVFGELTDYFQLLWSRSRELTDEAFKRFIAWHKTRSNILPDEYSEDESLLDEHSVAPTSGASPAIENEPMFGPLTTAAIDQLRRAGRPQRAQEIYRAMQKEGYEGIPTRSTKPYKPVYTALLSRETGVGDVFRTGPGLWNLAEWYSPEETELLKQQHIKAREDHIERTKHGMKEAQLRGQQLGAPHVMTDEMKARALQLLQEGRSAYQIADLLDVSVQTVYTHLRRKIGDDEWNSNERYRRRRQLRKTEEAI
jgi:DNA-binding CsgD family transcriptional regulator